MAVWDILGDAVRFIMGKFSGDEVAVLIDGNARVGVAEFASQYVGPCEAVRESRNGAALRLFASSAGLYLVNTFFDAGCTWHCNRGGYARIDYILMSERLLCATSACAARHDMDIMFTGWEDHYLLACVTELMPVARAAGAWG